MGAEYHKHVEHLKPGCPDEAIFNSILSTNQKLPPFFLLPLSHTHTGTQIHTLLHPHRLSCTHIQPSSIYNSWHDPVPPLREELREFKSWPNYAPLRFAPSALCSQKVERMAAAHTKAATRTHALLSEQTACFRTNSPASHHTHIHTLTQLFLCFSHTNLTLCDTCWVNLHFSISETQSLYWELKKKSQKRKGIMSASMDENIPNFRMVMKNTVYRICK